MIETIEGVESLRVINADGNLSIVGASEPPLKLRCERQPLVRRNDAVAELYIRGNAELAVPPGVAVEVLECTGNLELSEFKGNLVLGHVAGRLSAREIGSIAIPGTIDGGCKVEQAEAVKGACIKGDLHAEQVRSVSFDLVAGSAFCVAIAGDVAIEQIGGRCGLEQVGGAVRCHTVGGKLKASALLGDLTVTSVAGKVSIDGAQSVRIGAVGGQVSLRSVSGNVEIPSVGGAARLSGGMAAGKSWQVKTGGRIIVELEPGASVAVDAAARHGRVRLYGVEGDLHFPSRDRLVGTFGAGECKLVLETLGSDIIIERERAHERATAGSPFDWREFGAPFESLVENLGEDIPDMVGEIVGAAGKIVAETGALSSGVVRGVKHGVSHALREVERGINELKREVPEGASDKLSKLGREIRDLVNETLEQHRHNAADRAECAKERLREAVRQMREEMMRGCAAAGQKAGRAEAPGGQSKETAAGGEPSHPATDDQVLKVLAAVRAGEIEPADADDMIRALMEAEGSAPGAKPAAG